MSTVQREPARRFYWAVLDASKVGISQLRRRALRERLGYLFESYLPVPIEHVHTAYARVTSGGAAPRYVACGLGHSALEGLVGPGAAALVPEALPQAIGDVADASSLNLLTGVHTPRRVRALRARCLLIGLAAVLASSLALSLGLVRRAGALDFRASEIQARETKLYETALGAEAIRPGELPPERRLVAELRRLEQTRTSAPSALAVENAAATLVAVLRQWPNDLHAQTQSLLVTPAAVTVRAGVPHMSDAQELSSALARVSGWLVEQPQSEARDNQAEVTINMRRVAAREESR